MATLDVSSEKVLDLLDQLPIDEKRRALQRLLADPAWDNMRAYGENALDKRLAERGLDRTKMTADEIEAAVGRIADE